MARLARATVIALLLLAVGLPAAAGGSRPAASPRLRLHAAGGGTPGPISGAAARAARGELLPMHPAQLARAKAAATGRAASSVRPAIGPSAPVTTLGAEGLNDPNFTPSDSTGAIGPNSYIEIVNSLVGIYNRTLSSHTQDTLENWWGETGASVFDPQVIWDPTTHRFYYTGDVVFSGTDNRLAFGFSKISSPTNATTDWCHYDFGYGSEFPDYPKLGDSKDFAIIGVNVFNGTNYRGSDLVTFSKPPAGTTCPAANTFKVKKGKNLSVNGIPSFTPVPANEIDTKRTGYVLAIDGRLPPSTKLGVFTVTKNPTTGNSVIQRSGDSIRVPSYNTPPFAPQSGSSLVLDTLDTRLTQAVGAVDPLHQSKFAVWTQHTISGGAGSMVRWYEVDPAARTVLQKGTVSDGSLYVFNGAISPDRVVAGSSKAFGGNMVMGVNTSSSSAFPAIQMVSKVGSGAVSAMVLVQPSPGHDEDFGCSLAGVCRWGDYAAATPDPAASVSGSTGSVWLTGMWTADANTTGGSSGVSWRTWNWEATP
jgi:hypothetical protein